MQRMYALLLLIPLNMVCVFAFAQEKVEGLGIFKLNETDTSVITKLEKGKGYTRMAVNSKFVLDKYLSDYRFQKGFTIIEFQADTFNVKNNPSWAHYCADASTFLLSKCTLMGITCENVILTFYQGKLNRLECQYPGEMVDSITAKYGKPEVTVYEEDGNCTTQNKVYTRTWTNGDIECVMQITVNDNPICNLEPYRQMWLDVKSIEAIMNPCDMQRKDEILKKGR